MKLFCKPVLLELGFTVLPESHEPDLILSKNNFKLTLNADGSCYYLNTGIQYPVKDLSSLKKLYREVKGAEINVDKQ